MITRTKLYLQIIVFSWGLIIGIKPICAQKNSFCEVKNSTTVENEILYYKVFYNLAGANVGAAEVSFSNQLDVFNSKPVYHFKGSGGTLPSYDWFFKVRDVYESWVDTSNMQPLKFVRNVHEGNRRIYNQALFNHTLGQIVSSNRVFQMPACTQDVLSAIYFARNIDFSKSQIGDKISFNMYLDDEIYPIYLRYLGKEKIKTPYGTYNSIKFKPLLIEGTIFTGGEDMTVYVSDDIYKIPVLIETPILIGKIKVYLTKATGLRSK